MVLVAFSSARGQHHWSTTASLYLGEYRQQVLLVSRLGQTPFSPPPPPPPIAYNNESPCNEATINYKQLGRKETDIFV